MAKSYCEDSKSFVHVGNFSVAKNISNSCSLAYRQCECRCEQKMDELKSA